MSAQPLGQDCDCPSPASTTSDPRSYRRRTHSRPSLQLQERTQQDCVTSCAQSSLTGIDPDTSAQTVRPESPEESSPSGGWRRTQSAGCIDSVVSATPQPSYEARLATGTATQSVRQVCASGGV